MSGVLFTDTNHDNNPVKPTKTRLPKIVMNTDAQQSDKLYRITNELLDDLCALAALNNVSGQWEPLLSDPDDEAFVQLAFEAAADYLVTHNTSHYEPAKARGIRVVIPKEFLAIVRAVL